MNSKRVNPKRGNPVASRPIAKRRVDSKKKVQEDFALYRRPILSSSPDLYKLRDSYEFVLSGENEDLTFACGERYDPQPENNQFVFRLLLMNQETGKLAHIEFYMDSFNLLMLRADITCSLLKSREKALIFQTEDVQVYVMEEDPVDGFLAHFEDRRRVKISLNASELERWAKEYKDKVDRLYKMFDKRTAERIRRLEKKLIEQNKPKPEELLIGLMQPRVREYINYAE